MQNWEYKMINYNYRFLSETCKKIGMNYTTDWEEIFNYLGSKGWELVTNSGSTGENLIFKRPKDEKFPKITKEMERQAELQINEEEWPDVAFPRK